MKKYTIISIGSSPKDLEYQENYPEGIIYADKGLADRVAKRMTIESVVKEFNESK